MGYNPKRRSLFDQCVIYLWDLVWTTSIVIKIIVNVAFYIFIDFII